MDQERISPTLPTHERESLPEREVGVIGGDIRVVDRPLTHISEDPAFRETVRRALAMVTMDSRDLKDHAVFEVAFPENIGETRWVNTTEHDEIVYARRYHRRGPSRFVKYREADPTNVMTVVLLRKKDAQTPTYILITAHPGPKAAYEPWDQHATAADAQFWRTHALVYSPDDIMPDSEVSEAEFFRRPSHQYQGGKRPRSDTHAR